MYVMIGLLFVTVVVLMALAIPENGPLHTEEMGFMTACEDEVGNLYPLQISLTDRRVHPQCATMEAPILWERDQIPLRVWAVTGNPNTPIPPGRAARRMVQWANGFGGANFRILAPADSEEDADIRVYLGVAHMGVDSADSIDSNGSTEFRRMNGRLYAEIRTSNNGTVAQEYMVLMHELGHALGLGHDASPASIMHRHVEAPSEGLPRPFMSDDDKRLLRRTYQ